ncbi:MAG: carbamoyltransferase HypF, partial [Bacilli bacterium]
NIIKPIRIDSLEAVSIAVMGDKQFVILTSELKGQATGLFPPDLAVCLNCLHDLDHVHSRFYQYPFTSCTACGPRFSAIRSLPYDRLRTSFDRFQVCRLCQKEYEHPSNRRFHAQTIACPRCGPLIEIRDATGNVLSENWLSVCYSALRDGVIMAVKGTGGIHLVCNAKLKRAVEKLRVRKRRPNKPFALMAKDWLVVKAYFEISNVEMEALKSAAAPIVLLKPKPEASGVLPLEIIAPGLKRIGIMLPNTPLHHMLFADEIDWVVATSGNQSGNPITYDNKNALQHLQGVADLFVLHSREIVMWIDDSVGQEVDGEFQLMRRARGYVPEAFPIPLPKKLEVGSTVWPTVLGVGAELKNTFCFLHNGKAVLSQHIGDIRTLESIQTQLMVRDHFMQLLQLKPHLTVFDPHPDYLISREIQQYTSTMAIPIYHHHAHMAACMAENGIDTPIIGCILDGTGYGPDGTLWGFEILVGDYISFERVQHLQPIVLPG